MKVGVIVPIGIVGSPGGVRSYPKIRGHARAVEAAGLDSVWIYDHLVFHFPDNPREGVLEAWTVLSGLAEATERVELGTFVLCSPHRNPALLAKMAVTLDEISGGRLILGLGAGWNEPAFTMFGYPFDHLVDRFEEALQIITPLVREGAVNFQGTYSSAIDCELIPPPQRKIPVMIGANKPRMLRLTAQYADSWNTGGMGGAEAFAAKRQAMTAAAHEVGRDPATLEFTAGINIAFPDLGDVPADAADPAKYLSGSTDQLATALRAYAEAGVGHVMAWLYPLTDASISRFAEAVTAART
jgi:probable F420-dependent oxidoreductase